MKKFTESPNKKMIRMTKKMSKQKYKQNDILAVVHETAKGLHDAGLMSIATMRTFDAMCLPPVQRFTPKEIKNLRLREKVSQPVFAEYLNASASTIKKWETGEKHPTGPALKLLNIVADRGLEILMHIPIVNKNANLNTSMLAQKKSAKFISNQDRAVG